jgi:hypothetical protein
LIPGRPALRGVALAEGREERSRRPDDVVLAGKNDERRLERPQYLFRGIELCGLRKMGDVAGKVGCTGIALIASTVC